MISSCLALSRPTPLGGTFKTGAGGQDVTRRHLAQQPGPTAGKGQHLAGPSSLTGEAIPLQSWGPCCHQQQPQTTEICCGHRNCKQQQSQPPQSRHKRGNAQGEETEVQDSGI